MSVTAEELAQWAGWVGREMQTSEPVCPALLDRFAAAVGETRDAQHQMPSLGHWALFLEAALPQELGTDGHPRRGGFLPPVTLPRRMFAASEVRLMHPLRIGSPARQVMRIADLQHKRGSTGELVLLTLQLDTEQSGNPCVSETRTIIYREQGEPTPLPAEGSSVPPTGSERWTPGPVDLFRFSAVTFNSHRLHYDRPYAREVEGYPELVVHGPFTAARLFALARSQQGDIRRFTFRAQAPLFAGQTVVLAATGPGRVSAIRCDGVEAMGADYETRGDPSDRLAESKD